LNLAIGVLASLLLALNTLLWVPLLLAVAFVRLLLPVPALRDRLTVLATRIAEGWVSGNSAWMRLTQRTRWDVQGVGNEVGEDGEACLDARGWIMVTSNHQSWADIFVLQHLLNRRIPLLKFFLKQQLIWVPLMGLAWWALEFPFMRRHSEAALKKHPELRTQDQEATRRACAKFARTPTSVMNFLEGTRFTPAKQASQQSPYRHLLKPKAGGLALALNAMGDKFQAILDVTIVYPHGVPTFWQFLCGRVPRVVVRVRRLPIPQHLLGADYGGDALVRAAFGEWVQALWREKDEQITLLLSQVPAR
jgi:1-acyl-sn-glycerol-3-phosphate acyltransferase